MRQTIFSFMDTRKRTMIQQLVVQIEQQLGWGSGSQWSNKDFEALSEVIFEKTKKRLKCSKISVSQYIINVSKSSAYE